jgi:hypothetical protein
MPEGEWLKPVYWVLPRRIAGTPAAVSRYRLGQSPNFGIERLLEFMLSFSKQYHFCTPVRLYELRLLLSDLKESRVSNNCQRPAHSCTRANININPDDIPRVCIKSALCLNTIRSQLEIWINRPYKVKPGKNISSTTALRSENHEFVFVQPLRQATNT